MAMMKVKKDDGMSLVGKIITIIFIIILAAAIYYFVTLFKGVEINAVNLAGEWKQAGNPTWFITFTADGNPEEGYDGTAHSWYQSATGEITSDKHYTFYLEENANGVMVLHLYDKSAKKEEEIKITKLSRAEMSVIRNGSNFETITKCNIF